MDLTQSIRSAYNPGGPGLVSEHATGLSLCPKMKTPVPPHRLAEQIHDLGVTRGGVLLVHTAFSRTGPVSAGPRGLIDALRAGLGSDGTLVMPSMSDDDEHPFDPRRTPCHGMGVAADTFWRLPGVLRSDSPHAFAAIGPEAAVITASHPPDIPHGIDSPVDRVYELDGQVLLLGVGHDANTTIHLAESLAGVRYRRRKHLTLLKDGKPQRLDYREIDHCCENFNLMDEWLESAASNAGNGRLRAGAPDAGQRCRRCGARPAPGKRNRLSPSAGSLRRMRRGPRRDGGFSFGDWAGLIPTERDASLD